MQFIEILFLFLISLCSATNLQLEKNDGKYYDSAPLPFQNELEELFRAYKENDIERMDDILEFFEDNSSAFDELNDSEYAKERIQFVVSNLF